MHHTNNRTRIAYSLSSHDRLSRTVETENFETIAELVHMLWQDHETMEVVSSSIQNQKQ